MARDEKLIERIRRRPSEATFGDVRRLLEMFGYEVRTGGKHTAVCTHPTMRSFTIATVSGPKVKRRYLDDICKQLGLDE